MSCEGFIAPLDLECLFVNTFAGSYDIFIGIAFIAIAILAGKFKIMNIGVAVLYGLFIILISVLSVFKGWLMLVILILGFAIAFTASKLIKQ
jgi:hypothetical protein